MDLRFAILKERCLLHAGSQTANRKSQITKVIGLSGGIASGKTTVARMFERLGASVINADEIAHEILRMPTVRRWIVRRWGRKILAGDGSLDRHELGAIVFGDATELRALERMTHPAILKEITRRIRICRAEKSPLIVLDAPLLNEAHLDGVCDAQVFVGAKTAQRRARSARARRWTQKELRRRESQQMPLAEKRRRADYVIDNSGSLRATWTQVRRLWMEMASE